MLHLHGACSQWEREERPPQLRHQADEEARGTSDGSHREVPAEARHLRQGQSEATARDGGCRLGKQRESDHVLYSVRIPESMRSARGPPV